MEKSENINKEKAKAKILVIDDEPSILNSLKAILKRQNYLVDVAENYAVIKDKLFTEGYDSLILDIILPDVDGITILHDINKSGLNLPTIMLTGAPSLDTAQESVKYGAYDYLTKPIQKELLLKQLNNAVNKKRLIDSKRKIMEELKNENVKLEDLVDSKTKELRVSEIRYKAIIESVHDMIIITDNEGKINFSNIVFLDEMSKVMKKEIKVSDLLGMNISEIIPTIQDMKLSELFEKLSDGQEFEELSLKFSEKYNIESSQKISIHGIFTENLDLSEVILIISN